MAIERTLSIIKPDAVAKNVIGQIYARFEGAGLKVIASKMAYLSEREAGEFYGRARFAPISPNPSTPTPCMAPMLGKPQPWKSLSSSPA